MSCSQCRTIELQIPLTIIAKGKKAGNDAEKSTDQKEKTGFVIKNQRMHCMKTNNRAPVSK